MDEYCIVPKRVLDARNQPTSYPAETKDVLSLNGLLDRICQRTDIDDWQKAGMLQSALERYMALTNDKRDNSLGTSSAQDVDSAGPSELPVSYAATAPLARRQKRPLDEDTEPVKRGRPLPPVEVPKAYAPTAPLTRRQKRTADDDAPIKRGRKGLDITLPGDDKIHSQVEPVIHDEWEKDTSPVLEATPQFLEKRGKKRDRGIPVDAKLEPLKKRASTRKRVSDLTQPSKKLKLQSGGLKSRWIVL